MKVSVGAGGMETKEAKKESVILKLGSVKEKIKNMIMEMIGEDAKLKDIDLVKSGNKLELNVKLKTKGIFTITLTGDVVNKEDKIDLQNINIDAAALIKGEVEEKLGPVLPKISSMFIEKIEQEKNRKVSKIQVDPSGNLAVEFEASI